MKQYLDLVQRVLTEGVVTEDRTGVGTLSMFGHQSRYDLREGFPLLSSKRVPFKAVKGELLWFLRGDTNIEWLHEHGITIWDDWANENGDLGPIYGSMWRSWPHYYMRSEDDHGFANDPIDQIANVIESIKSDPHGRRHIVSAWNPSEIDDMALPPCHLLFQFYVRNGQLSCQLYQRSADLFLGVPFNIASYALLTHMIARECGLGVGEFVHTIGDAHIYKNHVEQCSEMLRREDRTLPILSLNPLIDRVDEFGMADISIVGYNPHPAIAGDVAV